MRRVLLAALLSGLGLQFSFAQASRQLERPGSNGPQRVALVIGNAAYTKARPLANPANDASDMARALSGLGFEVFSGVDLDKRGMEKLIREFGNKLANGGTGVFYYAGHGIQVRGENFLVPIDADIPEENEVGYATVTLGLVLEKMSSAKNELNIIILDACRNNPYARSWRGYRDATNSDGLAKISPPTGTLVLYATEPGKVASDGIGRNGLFTDALLKQISRPNLEYDQLVKAVSTDVWQRSDRKQLPWKEGNSLLDFYFVARTELSVPPPTNLRLLSLPQPPYTEEGRKNSVQGTVSLMVEFLDSGQIGTVRPITTLPYGLTEKAIAAAKQIRFVPATVNGQAITRKKVVEFNFRLY